LPILEPYRTATSGYELMFRDSSVYLE
jgi:hypothetical protein